MSDMHEGQFWGADYVNRWQLMMKAVFQWTSNNYSAMLHWHLWNWSWCQLAQN